MDRDFLKNNMSAFLDGELEPKQMREFEHEIQSYPDLFVEFQTLQRLNKLAMETQVPLPDDRYFDKLADQIDAQIKREAPQERSRIVNFLLERRKTVAIISSVAAVFLIAVIGMNLYGPNAKRYPSELRNIELNPAIIKQPKTDTVTVWPEHEKQIVPPPVVEEEASRESTKAKARIADVKKEADASIIDSVAILQPRNPASTSIVMPAPDTVVREDQIITVERNLISEPQMHSSDGWKKFKPTAYAKSIDSGLVEEQVIFRVPAVDRKINGKSKRTNILVPLSSGSTGFESIDMLASELSRSHFPERLITGRMSARDSLAEWFDSLFVIDPALWHAEQSYRESQIQELTDENFARWKIYIEHYISLTNGDDLKKWRGRLDAIHEKYEISKGKIYEPGRPHNE